MYILVMLVKHELKIVICISFLHHEFIVALIVTFLFLLRSLNETQLLSNNHEGNI